jgi:hypothetical protein
MLIEIIHINGQYSPEKRSHIPPDNLPMDYYPMIVPKLARAADKGATLLYRPNLTTFTHNIFDYPDEIGAALASDPFLAEARTLDIEVMPDGKKPLKLVEEDIRREDTLLRRCGRAVIFGAYLNECVPFEAGNLKSRNPNLDVGIDFTLSIDRGISASLEPEYGYIPHKTIAA